VAGAGNGAESSVPEIQKGEKLNAWVSKYMGSKKANKDFPDQKQRAAVAYSEWREKKKKKREAA
jgi:hypothetical protein